MYTHKKKNIHINEKVEFNSTNPKAFSASMSEKCISGAFCKYMMDCFLFLFFWGFVFSKKKNAYVISPQL